MSLCQSRQTPWNTKANAKTTPSTIPMVPLLVWNSSTLSSQSTNIRVLGDVDRRYYHRVVIRRTVFKTLSTLYRVSTSTRVATLGLDIG